MNDIESQMDWVRVANGKYQSLMYHPQFQIMNSIWGGSLETIHSSPETMGKCKILSRFSSKSEFYDFQDLSIFDSIPPNFILWVKSRRFEVQRFECEARGLDTQINTAWDLIIKWIFFYRCRREAGLMFKLISKNNVLLLSTINENIMKLSIWMFRAEP